MFGLRMFGLVRPVAMLATDRETAMIAALAALVVAGASVGIGAVVMLWRELRASRPSPPPAPSPRA